MHNLSGVRTEKDSLYLEKWTLLNWEVPWSVMKKYSNRYEKKGRMEATEEGAVT